MATDLGRINRTLEEETRKSAEENSTSLADVIIEAYQKRKEKGDA